MMTTLQLSRSEEHTSELQSLRHIVCRLLLEKKKPCIDPPSCPARHSVRDRQSCADPISGRAMTSEEQPPCDNTPGISKWSCFAFFFNDTATTEIYTLSLHDALPI